jgi:transcriptional regulator with XRE-family HTH domain
MTTAVSMGVTAYSKLARSRKELELTQRDVAEKIGVTVTHFNRVENGHKTVTADQLFAWAEAVGCTISITRNSP